MTQPRGDPDDRLRLIFPTDEPDLRIHPSMRQRIDDAIAGRPDPQTL